MTDTIKLPPLPLQIQMAHPTLVPYFHIVQLATARAVQEACANVAEDQTQEYENYTGQSLNLAYQCAEAVRALEFDV
jgi:hypothetical protein